MKTRYFILFIIFTALLYIALFPHQLDPEFTISPAWNISLHSTPRMNEEAGHPFVADDLYGNSLSGVD